MAPLSWPLGVALLGFPSDSVAYERPQNTQYMPILNQNPYLPGELWSKSPCVALRVTWSLAQLKLVSDCTQHDWGPHSNAETYTQGSETLAIIDSVDYVQQM